jgi:hypothetical protein
MDFGNGNQSFGRIPPPVPPLGVVPSRTIYEDRLARSRGRGLHSIHYDDDYSSSDEADDTANGMKNSAKHVTIEGSKKKIVKTGTDDDMATPDDDSQSTYPIEDPIEPGMACDLKNLYSGKEDKRGRFQWQDSVPADIKDPVENEETAKYA